MGFLGAGCNGNSGEPRMASELDMEMRSICVGRYLMDIPVNLKRQQRGIDSGGDATFYFGRNEDFTKIDVTVGGAQGRDAFESAVLVREGELRQRQHFSTNGPMLLSREGLSSGAEFLSFYASRDSTEAIRLEVHGLLNEAHVVLAETAYSAETRASIQSRLIAMLSSLRSLKVAGRGGRGFCVGDVIFDLESDYEEAEFAYAGSLDGVPTRLQIDINTFEQAPDEPALIERGESNLEGLGIRSERLKAGSRLLAGEAGDEWLGAFVENDQRLHGFYAETRTRKPTRESPKVLVSLSTGEEDAGPTGRSMDDDLAVALWESVLKSMRKRSE